jgi:DNA-binding beta-propeller fold protein YncE
VSALLLGTGAIGVAATITKNVNYALRSDVATLGGPRLWYRAMVAYLHFLQPLARIRGQIRGMLSPPHLALPSPLPQTSRGPRPSPREAWRALLLLSGGMTEDRYWSEGWTTGERVLTAFTEWLRRSHAVRVVEVDEGWSEDRDVSALVGRWAWLDVRALVEDHGSGRSLLRVSTHLRPTGLGVLGAVVLAAALLAAASAGVALRWPLPAAGAASLAVLLTAFTAWRTAQATATLHRGMAAVASAHGMVRLKSGPARAPLVAPSLVRTYALRSAAVFLVMILALAAGTFVLRDAATAQIIGQGTGYAGDQGPAIQAWLDMPGGIAVAPTRDVYFADSNNHVIRRIDAGNNISTVIGNNALGPGFSGDFGPAIAAQLHTPNGVALAPDGDIVVADSWNNRVRRVDRETGVIVTVAGSGEAGFGGDAGPAVEAALYMPSAVAVAPNGDIYIADTLNYCVRMVDHVTGFIHTVAGRGPAPGEPLGDGGLAVDAVLNMPSDVAIAPNGDIYIADMHNQLVRKVDARTRRIVSAAGSGTWGFTGDGGPATEAALAGPAGIALAAEAGDQLTVYIADYYNGQVRAVGPDGIIRNVGSESRVTFEAPTRVAFAPARGTLWVADTARDRLVALNVRPPASRPGPSTPPAPPRRATE